MKKKMRACVLLGALSVNATVLIAVDFTEDAKKYVVSPQFVIGSIVAPLAVHYGSVVIEEVYYALFATQVQQEKRAQEKRLREEYDKYKVEKGQLKLIMTKRQLFGDHQELVQNAPPELKAELQKNHDVMLRKYSKGLTSVF